MPVRSLKDATLKVADAGGTGGGNVVTVTLEAGDISWTERTPVNIISDRGVLDHARLANEEPVEVSFSVMHEAFQAGNVSSGTISLREALTLTDGASGWTSDEPNSDTSACILEITISDPAGGASETITFARFHAEELSFAEGDPFDTLSVTGRGVETAPTYA